MKKVFKSAIILSLCAVCVAVCALFAACDYEEIYNNDSKLTGGTSCSRINSNRTNYVGFYYEKCNKFNGVDLIGTVTVDETALIKVDLTVSSGKFKIVLVNGKSVYKTVEAIDFTQAYTFNGALPLDNIPTGSYKMKMVGVDADFIMNVTY